MSESVLVIGASSFTGKHFCAYAKERGATVIEASLRDSSALLEHLRNHPDYVVNFAALNVVAPSWEYPEDYIHVNVELQLPIWDSICHRPPKKYVHISTPEVYGSTRGSVEESAPYNPSTPYAASRTAAELMLKCYHKERGAPVVFTRACNVYGPGQQLYRLIPKVIASIKKEIRFPLEGGGKSRRAFCHVYDVCDATWRVMKYAPAGSAWHIAPIGKQKRICDIVYMICREMGSAFDDVVTMMPERPGKDFVYQLRSGPLRHLEGEADYWTDTINLKRGIAQVIAWINRDWKTLKNEPLDYEFKS